MPIKYIDSNSKAVPENEPKKQHTVSGLSTTLSKVTMGPKPPQQQKKYSTEIERELHPDRVATRERMSVVLRFVLILLIIIFGLTLANVTGVFDAFVAGFSSQISQKGGIVITSEFTRAEAFLNGKSVGDVPLQLTAVNPGEYTLRLVAKDDTAGFYAPLEIPINIYSGNTTIVKAQIGPTSDSSSYIVVTSQDKAPSSPFRFIVASVPDAVDVLVNDQKIGQTPLTQNDVKSGTQKIKLTKDGYRDIEVEIDVNEQKVTTITAKLYKYIIKL